MAHSINIFLQQQFRKLPLLCEKTGALAIVEPRQAGS